VLDIHKERDLDSERDEGDGSSEEGRDGREEGDGEVLGHAEKEGDEGDYGGDGGGGEAAGPGGTDGNGCGVYGGLDADGVGVVDWGADAVAVGFVVAVTPDSQVKLAHGDIPIASFPTEFDFNDVHCRESRVGNGRDDKENEGEEEEKEAWDTVSSGHDGGLWKRALDR